MRSEFVVPVREKLAFGIGDFAFNIAYTTMGFYFIYFLVNVAGLPAFWAGIVFLLARIWDAFLNLIVGNISDRTETRFGRRRPYILFGSIPFGIAFVFLWIVPVQGTVPLLIYYLFITFLFNALFSLTSMPYNAMMPELTQDYDERTSISGYRMGLSFVGNLVAAAGVAVIVDVFYHGRMHYRESYPVMGIIFAVVIIVSLLITFWGTHERVKPEKISSEGLVATMQSILKLMEFRIVLGMFLFNMIALDLIQTLFVFFLKDVIHVPENMTFVVMGLPLVIAVAAAPLWVFLGEKLGKRKAYILSTCYFIVVLLSALFAPVYNLAFIIVLAVLSGVGISASQIIPFSIIPDIIEIDEIQHGTRREGAFYGSMMFLYKLASAVVIGLAAAVLGYFGYVENSTLPQPDSAIICIRVLLGLGPGALFLISVYFVKILPITKESFDAVKRIIEERKRRSTT